MDTKSILSSLFSQGQDMLKQGANIAEDKLNVPEDEQSRKAMYNGMGKGALAAGALALLLGTKTGRKVSGSAVKIGGLAAVGTLAYKAYQNWQNQGNADDIPANLTNKPIAELDEQYADQRSILLIKAMIAAAKADGHISTEERNAINKQVLELGLDQSALASIEQTLDKPLNPDEIALMADSPQAAAEIYVVSRIVISPDHFMEKAYLDQLANSLNLEDDFIAQLEQEISHVI